MRIARFDWDGEDPAGLAAEIRDLQPKLDEVSEAVAEIVAAVESEGDAAVLRFEQKFGDAAPAALRLPGDEIRGTAEAIPEELARAIATAAVNVHNAAEAEVEADREAAVADDSKTVSYQSVPVASAGAYVPGGAGAYVSTAVMCCVPAQAAGVERIAVASPPGSDGKLNPAILAAATIAGATEI